MPELAVTTAITSWGAGPAPAGTRVLVLLLHGYGSNEADLASLAPALPAGFAWASLRAPLTLSPGSFSWFPITTPGAPAAEPVEVATDAITEWIAQTVPAETAVVPLGFSQGGLMASQLLRSATRRVAASVILGGFVLGHPQPGDEALTVDRPPVFSGRGTLDGVITAEAVARTEAWLPEHSTLTSRHYDGLGHGISPEELADVVAFLEALAPTA
ncbi:alpha/beta hydrolase [Herbiconiux sp. YIM B11900]|uniref:alpha/beta hydrolase n=1 Tax=Herbiconiux sp. YIM B11900 TaxID=3404131 RepID=UPI003F86A033